MFLFYIAQKIKKNRKRHAANKEMEQFIENNLLNEKLPDKHVIFESTKVSDTKVSVILDTSGILTVVNFLFILEKEKKTKHDTDNVQAENRKLYEPVNEDLIEIQRLQETIRQLQAELEEKNEALSYANNQPDKQLQRSFEKTIMGLEGRLEKHLIEVKNVVTENVNQLDEKISNIENTLSTLLTFNIQKVLDWINILPALRKKYFQIYFR